MTPNSPPTNTQAKNVVSVDFEDYYHVEAFSRQVNRQEWASFPSRIERNTHQVLDVLDAAGVSATFFMLGWAAERYPQIVREIVNRGHEAACHSYWHRLIYNLTPEEFRQDTILAKDTIEQASGVAVVGYRAPSFSIVERSWWAFEILAELGFQYDSSVFPIRHDTYGIPAAPRRPFEVDTPHGSIREYPMTTFRFGSNANLPVAGGGYLRLFPFFYTRFGVSRAAAEHVPVIAYIHPWEFDADQPRITGGSMKSRIRHYTNLAETKTRFTSLLRLVPFTSFREVMLTSKGEQDRTV